MIVWFSVSGSQCQILYPAGHLLKDASSVPCGNTDRRMVSASALPSMG